MARHTPLDDLSLHARSPHEPPGQWLGRALREMIRTGRLRADTRLPSTRRLAEQHGVARGTVVEVFAQMITEGYLHSHAGSGTYVCSSLPDDYFTPSATTGGTAMARNVAIATPPAPPLAERGQELQRSPFYGVFPDPRPRAFRAYQPAVDLFPVEVWARIASRRMRAASRQQLLTGDEFGWLPLRQAMAEHLALTRGLVCGPEQVMVVSGTQHALDFVTRLLVNPGEAVWMEDPGYPGASSILKASGAKVIPVPVDEHGMRVRSGLRRAPDARMAYVTPANQFPLGVLLSLERRMQLLAWARERGAWIFEDDYDSEFRFTGRPLSALQGLEPGAHVIYSCSCNKMLFPTLRLGFLVLPPALVEPARIARSMLDRHPSLLDQLVLADFIQDGHFGRHLRKMRQAYAEKHAVLQEAVASRLSGILELGRCDTGLQTTAWLPPHLDDRAFARRMAADRVEVMPLSNYALRWPVKNAIHLGFAAVDAKELKRGVAALEKALDAGSRARGKNIARH